MELTEAEIQVLASIAILEADNKATKREDVEKRGAAYWTYKEDWSDAFETLANRGLVDSYEAGIRITEAGRQYAEKFRKERPDHYWYQYKNFYVAAHASQPHT